MRPIHFNLHIACLVFFCASCQAAEITEKANKLIQQEAGLSLDAYSKGEHETVGQALDKFKKAMDDRSKAKRIDIQANLSQLNLFEAMPQELLLQINAEKKAATIAEIRAIALQNNLPIRIAQLEPVIQQTYVSEERAKFDNVLFAALGYTEKDLPAESNDNVVFSSNNPALNKQVVKLTTEAQKKQMTEALLGFMMPLRTGGKLTLSSPIARKESMGTVDSDEYNGALKFSFSQPLLRDAGIDVNEASIKIAGLEQQASAARAKLQSMRIIAMVDKAYWELVRAWAELNVRNQQYDFAMSNLEMVRRRVEEGLSATIEINRAQVGLATQMDALILAKTKVSISQRQLKFYLDGDVSQLETDFVYVPTTKPNLVAYNLDKTKLIETALQDRLELLEQELKLTADLSKIDYLENQTLPLFTLDYQYGALSDTNSSFSRAFSGVGSQGFNDWSIGLRFEMPMTNEARKARLDRAVSERLQRLTTKTLQERTVTKEILDAVDYLEQDWQRIIAARQQVIIAGINYEAEVKQFKEGLRTMTEVQESLTRLGDAQLREIRAMNDYQVSQIDLAYATGTLLGYSRVSF
jgi:outer membrane protein